MGATLHRRKTRSAITEDNHKGKRGIEQLEAGKRTVCPTRSRVLHHIKKRPPCHTTPCREAVLRSRTKLSLSSPVGDLTNLILYQDGSPTVVRELSTSLPCRPYHPACRLHVLFQAARSPSLPSSSASRQYWRRSATHCGSPWSGR